MKALRTLGIFCIVLLLIGTVNSATVKVDEPAVCLVCHDDIGESMNKKNVHTAFKEGTCSSCHNPHASQHAALLNTKDKSLCLTCHEDYKPDGLQPHVHQPLLDGDCLSCHNPHASDFGNQLNQEMSLLCRKCHSETEEWSKQEVVHAPVSDGDCLACHDPHSSKDEGLVKLGIPELCFKCHNKGQELADVHKKYELDNSKCNTCHDPHASTHSGLLMANRHAPFAEENCDVCHTSGQGTSGFELVASVKTVCTGCHQELKKEDGKMYHHNMDDKKSCLNCHNAHVSSTGFLLAANQQILCMKCHFTDKKIYDKPREEYLTHESIDCSECHTPHGSNNNKYLSTQKSELCTKCHADIHRSSHPIGEDVIDPRTNEPITCLSCHQLHGADYKPYLPLNPKMDLCVQCHDK